jgi:hypothetical protein
MATCGLDSACDIRHEQVARYCEHDSESSGLIKCMVFSTLRETVSFISWTLLHGVSFKIKINSAFMYVGLLRKIRGPR